MVLLLSPLEHLGWRLHFPHGRKKRAQSISKSEYNKQKEVSGNAAASLEWGHCLIEEWYSMNTQTWWTRKFQIIVIDELLTKGSSNLIMSFETEVWFQDDFGSVWKRKLGQSESSRAIINQRSPSRTMVDGEWWMNVLEYDFDSIQNVHWNEQSLWVYFFIPMMLMILYQQKKKKGKRTNQRRRGHQNELK